MKKIVIFLSAILFFPLTASAALINDGSMMLSIDSGIPECIVGGTYPNCDFGVVSVSGGSFFRLDGVQNTVISQGTGIVLGSTQSYDGLGSNITDVWSFFGKEGTNFSTESISAISDTEIDMTGWRMAWDDTSEIDLGSGLFASISCGSCNVGDSYTLDYSTFIPVNDSSGLGGLSYELHLEGVISSVVPVPAAVWLFGSGLIGLFGFSKKCNR